MPIIVEPHKNNYNINHERNVVTFYRKSPSPLFNPIQAGGFEGFWWLEGGRFGPPLGILPFDMLCRNFVMDMLVR